MGASLRAIDLPGFLKNFKMLDVSVGILVNLKPYK